MNRNKIHKNIQWTYRLGFGLAFSLLIITALLMGESSSVSLQAFIGPLEAFLQQFQDTGKDFTNIFTLHLNK